MTQADDEDWLRILDDGLARNPSDAGLHFDRGLVLESLTRTQEAELAYQCAITADPYHLSAMLALARLYARVGAYVPAFRVCTLLLERYPDDGAALANYATMLYLAQSYHEAKDYYFQALARLPDDVEIHRGLALVAQALGDEETAAAHVAQALAATGGHSAQYRGSAAPIHLLLLVTESENGASSNFDPVLDDRIFAVQRLLVDAWPPGMALPPAELVVNGIVDADRSRAALRIASDLATADARRFVNQPDRVRQTARVLQARHLAQIPGVRTPRMVTVAASALEPTQRAQTLHAAEFSYPFLLRAPGFYAGRHFHFIESAERLASALAAMKKTEYLIIEYIQTQDAQGRYAKYRTLFIDGHIYPLHLAISERWKVHYFSSDMAANADHRDVEREFLNDHALVLGAKAMQSLHEVARTTGLEYAGADFGFDADGQLVIFEANAGMTVIRPGIDERFAYRIPAVDQIITATTSFLLAHAASVKIDSCINSTSADFE